MNGNAPIEVMLHIYFNFEYVKFMHYQTNRPHDGALCSMHYKLMKTFYLLCTDHSSKLANIDPFKLQSP